SWMVFTPAPCRDLSRRGSRGESAGRRGGGENHPRRARAEGGRARGAARLRRGPPRLTPGRLVQIGRASCRERGESAWVARAEDGIRDGHVTGVQTCALPISSWMVFTPAPCRDLSRRGSRGESAGRRGGGENHPRRARAEGGRARGAARLRRGPPRLTPGRLV